MTQHTVVGARSREAVRVEWRLPLAGFVVGLVAATLPAWFLVRTVLRTQLPLAGQLLAGPAGALLTMAVATCVGLAVAVVMAALPRD